MFFMTKPVVLHIAKFRGVHIDYQLDSYEHNVYQFNLSFSLALSRWWSDAPSAPRFTLTSSHLSCATAIYLVLCQVFK